MAALLGLATGGAAAFLGQKHLQKVQNEQMHQAFQMKAYMDAIHQDPTVINNPEFVKGFKKIYGEGSDDFIASQKPRAAEAMRNQQLFQQLISHGQAFQAGARSASTPQQFSQPQDVVRGGAVPGQLPTTSIQGPGLPPSMPAPAPQAAPGPAAPQAPSSIEDIDRQLQAARALQGYFAKDPENAGKAKALESFVSQLEKDRERALKPGEVSAAEQAKLDVENLPANVRRRAAAQATIGSARAGAEARAKLAPDIVKGEVAEAGAKAGAEASARAQVESKVGKPWTAKDALEARSSASNDAKRELTSSTLYGFKTKAPKAEDVQRLTDKKMLDVGLLPDGRRMSDIGAKRGSHAGRDGYYIPNPDGKTAKFYAIGT